MDFGRFGGESLGFDIDRHFRLGDLLGKIGGIEDVVELVSLKTQIGDVMRSAAPPATKTAETLPEEAEESAPGGFFDEEEDETIL